MPMYAYDRNANPDAQANLDRDFPDGGSSDVNAELLEALRGMADAYVALLLMKAEDPSRFQEPGSPYASALAAIARAERG